MYKRQLQEQTSRRKHSSLKDIYCTAFAVQTLCVDMLGYSSRRCVCSGLTIECSGVASKCSGVAIKCSGLAINRSGVAIKCGGVAIE